MYVCDLIDLWRFLREKFLTLVFLRRRWHLERKFMSREIRLLKKFSDRKEVLLVVRNLGCHHALSELKFALPVDWGGFIVSAFEFKLGVNFIHL
jgi:hypothetical protein